METIIPNTHFPPLLIALCNTAIYPHPVDSVRIIETHISWVLLAGEFAYKIKKPVNFGFLDFSTLAKRQFYCAEELRLNRRLSTDLYLEVLPITGNLAQPELAGQGQVLEYAIKMSQFPSERLLADMAARHLLDVECCDQIAERIAAFHDNISVAGDDFPYGDADTVQHWFDENFMQIYPLLTQQAAIAQMQGIQAWGDGEWQAKLMVMQERKRQGFVRECHGDLHLGNMTMIDDKVVLFDCIEFNPELRWIDVMSDVAFLLIDLLHYAYDRYANRALNRYLQWSGDYGGLALLRYYLVYRALVRAKLALISANQSGEAPFQQHAWTEYVLFSRLAERFIQPNQPVLIITHGKSASGKSTWAAQLAEQIGAIQLRSDIERKRLFGYRPEQHSAGEIYGQKASEQTYCRLEQLACQILKAGFSVIVDATFLKKVQRSVFQQLAYKCGAPFLIVDFESSEAELLARIEQRQTQADRQEASEANASVLRQQIQTAEPLTAAETAWVVNATIPMDDILAILEARKKLILPA